MIPAFNEEKSIGDALNTIDTIIRKKEVPYEIVVVDDGSCDKTLIRAIESAKKNGHIKVVSYKNNVGKINNTS